MSDSARILTQREMRVARTDIGFCYICGKPLPPKGPGRSKQIMGEHVVPRGLLGDPPEKDRWAVELDVHRSCEKAAKQGLDHLLGLLQGINITPQVEWPDPGHVRRLRLDPVLLRPPGGSILIPAFANADHILRGAWTWVRGLHAALYGECLPESTEHCALPPVPACGTKGGMSPEDAEKHSWMLRSVVQLAVRREKWDGINAWGQRLQYRCVWKHVPEEYGGPAWWCFWGLLFPGVLEWSRTVLEPGSEHPWHGHYITKQRPSGASFLTSEDFPKGTRV